MKRSTDRILTTHSGSLPRPPDLLEQLLRRDRGEAVDAAALEAPLHEAVADSVRREAAAGVAVVNDGEAGKIGYSTYVTERLEGFGGEADPPGPSPDMLEFPEYLARTSGDGDGDGGGPPRPPATARSPIATRRRSAPTSPRCAPRRTASRRSRRRSSAPRRPASWRSSSRIPTTATTTRTSPRSPTR
jgi:hypothetical protein